MSQDTAERTELVPLHQGVPQREREGGGGLCMDGICSICMDLPMVEKASFETHHSSKGGHMSYVYTCIYIYYVCSTIYIYIIIYIPSGNLT